MSKIKKVCYRNCEFYISKEVYEPAQDTWLIADHIEVDPSDIVLDIGTGCGILAILSAFTSRNVLAIDINPYAVKCTRLNAEINGVSERIDTLRGELFGPLRKASYYDLVMFNAPYLPTKEDEPRDWIDYAWSGGIRGRSLISSFIANVPKFLRPEGNVLLVQSTLSDIEETLKSFREKGFYAEIVDSHQFEFETIFLVRAKRTCR